VYLSFFFIDGSTFYLRLINDEIEAYKSLLNQLVVGAGLTGVARPYPEKGDSLEKLREKVDWYRKQDLRGQRIFGVQDMYDFTAKPDYKFVFI
jgi:hypothetical protein